MNPSARAQEIEDLLGDTTWLQEMARSMVGDPFTAEDLVQESLLQAKADGPWTTGKLGGWIAGVLRNKVLLHWRSERRRIAREQKAAFMHAAELELAEAEDRHPDPAVLTQRVEDQQILAETLLQLDDASREVLLLTYYGSRNVPQVA
ncbi:MAG: RNA polymerase sigma factor, partial [Planctomycetota bacterium]